MWRKPGVARAFLSRVRLALATVVAQAQRREKYKSTRSRKRPSYLYISFEPGGACVQFFRVNMTRLISSLCTLILWCCCQVTRAAVLLSILPSFSLPFHVPSCLIIVFPTFSCPIMSHRISCFAPPHLCASHVCGASRRSIMCHISCFLLCSFFLLLSRRFVFPGGGDRPVRPEGREGAT